MWRDWLLRAVQFLGGLLGAAMLASLPAVFSHPVHGFWPFLTAFAERLIAIGHGDFGRSIVSGTPAMAAVFAVLPLTLQLLAGGAIVAVLIGLPLGIFLSASRTLRAAAPFMQIIAATPVFVAALALVWIAMRVLHWSETPPQSALSWNELMQSGGWSAALQAFALPALTVGAAGAASVQLSLRRAAAATWSASYRNGLRMMGLSAFDVDLHFAVPEVLAGLLRDLGEIVLALISAAAVAEWVFQRNGVAVLFLKAAALGDWPVVAAALFVFAIMTLVVSFIGTVISQLLIAEDGP